MKVHPVPRKRNITLRYDIVSALSQANALSGRQKKLRRLPHIFAKVLELPFNSDADVSIEETSDSFRFVIPTDDAGNNIRADTVEIYPGVTKIVIRGDNVLDSSLGEFELDLWRFRLPPSTLPELATADFADGELVVTVPKDPVEEEVDDGGIGEAGRLILGIHGRCIMFLFFWLLVDCFAKTNFFGNLFPSLISDVAQYLFCCFKCCHDPVSSELGSECIAPEDAAIMQSTESIALGHVPRGGPASLMQSAASQNERIGVVATNDITDFAREQGVTVSQAEVGGTSIVSESVGGEVVAQYIYPSEAGGGRDDEERSARYPTTGVQEEAVTVGEALEAVALKPAGDKPIEQSDAAAIQAAEARATGRSEVVPGGVGAEAQRAASINAQTDDKTTLGDVLRDATSRLIDDKAVKKEDAEGVVGAEIRNSPDLATHPGGVAASITTASNLNKF